MSSGDKPTSQPTSYHFYLRNPFNNGFIGTPPTTIEVSATDTLDMVSAKLMPYYEEFAAHDARAKYVFHIYKTYNMMTPVVLVGEERFQAKFPWNLMSLYIVRKGLVDESGSQTTGTKSEMLMEELAE
ncbi:hypothetical protein GGI25_003303 [Coemansia spiralis]|uniref:Uncharacterized protein n=2 Tax=Coemansia TaxID=4863 RepID=A0A9W8G8S8_9FUNG|nr:hypothetical protein EDC05_002594 [Coemansia umbellata]KAJ2622533.1 hypothetical protein GGI26_003132 [Coemansia sp. RSA 1358]KAJ2677083.1 hypothetical protein GGI25_003303 [Coemansia spiralis]